MRSAATVAAALAALAVALWLLLHFSLRVP